MKKNRRDYMNRWREKNAKHIESYSKEYYAKSSVKKKKKAYKKKWREKNKEHIKEYRNKPEVKEKEKLYRKTPKYIRRRKAYNKKYTKKPENRERLRKNNQAHLDRNPWLRHWYHARGRCMYPSTYGYNRYGGRGIQFLITREDIKRIWIRDKADFMDEPNLHRKDNEGNYTYENCMFVEKSEHSKLHSKKV